VRVEALLEVPHRHDRAVSLAVAREHDEGRVRAAHARPLGLGVPVGERVVPGAHVPGRGEREEGVERGLRVRCSAGAWTGRAGCAHDRGQDEHAEASARGEAREEASGVRGQTLHGRRKARDEALHAQAGRHGTVGVCEVGVWDEVAEGEREDDTASEGSSYCCGI
jgi:hypothetical protein